MAESPNPDPERPAIDDPPAPQEPGPSGDERSDDQSESTSQDRSISQPTARMALALLLAATTGLMLWAAVVSIERVEGALGSTTEIAWAAPSSVVLRPGPAAFRHDVEEGVLAHRGTIDDERVRVLRELLEKPHDTEEAPEGRMVTESEWSAIERSYQNAIDELAFLSNAPIVELRYLILLLGGIGGMIGAQTRSIWSYIKVACYFDQDGRQRFDLKRWWPWYVMRPMLGFVLGAFVLVLVEAEFVAVNQADGQERSGAMWWLAVSFLVGFGTREFIARLRLLILTLFGQENASS